MCKTSGHRIVYELDESKYPSSTLVLCVPRKSVQRLVSACTRINTAAVCSSLLRSWSCPSARAAAPGNFRKQPLAVSSPRSAVAATANPASATSPKYGAGGVLLQSSLLSVTRPAPGRGSRLTPCQSKPPNPETSLGSAQAHYYYKAEKCRISRDFG